MLGRKRYRTCERCSKIPTFNQPGETKARFCAEHKEAGMVDVRSKTCERCGKQPTFNRPGETKARFCADHKEAGMVNVKSKTCERCGKIPTFNRPGEMTARFCAEHKEAGMVDVMSKTCERCATIASFGYPGHGVAFCATHKLAGTKTRPSARCSDCSEYATHGVTTAERCESHALLGDANLVEQLCTHCSLPNIVNADALCADCCAWLGGKTPKLAKQREVVQFLDVHLTEYPYSSVDKIPLDLKSCGGKERPDVLWGLDVLLDRVVILEVDENQHIERACECEQTRMVNISQALGCETTVWIRYNPDSFKGGHATKAKRHSVLKEWLLWAFTTPRDGLPTVSVVHLFFDGYAEGNVTPHQLL